jgi:hypothetical protein
MARQLERLKEYAAQTHISLRVLPFARGANPGMFGNFIMLEFSESDLDDLIHIETVEDITIKDDADFIGRYLDRFEELESSSLSTEDSLVYLDKVIAEMKSEGAAA